MNIVGFDSHFVVSADPRASMRKFGDLVAEVWSSVLVSIEPSHVPSATWRDASALHELAPGMGEVYLVRDEAMVEHFEKESYRTTADGTGAVALLYSKVTFREASLTVPVDSNVQPIRPAYTATFLPAGDTYAMQLITPDDPATHDFSLAIRNKLVGAFGAA